MERKPQRWEVKRRHGQEIYVCGTNAVWAEVSKTDSGFRYEIYRNAKVVQSGTLKSAEATMEHAEKALEEQSQISPWRMP